jgi:hypothetical protein
LSYRRGMLNSMVKLVSKKDTFCYLGSMLQKKGDVSHKIMVY